MTLRRIFLIPFFVVACNHQEAPSGTLDIADEPTKEVQIQAVNESVLKIGNEVIAFEDVRLIDGTGSDPVTNAVVIIRDNIIVEIGAAGTVAIPEEAEVIDGKGQTLLPGLIDAHFHLNNNELPNLVMQHGTTSIRDPGAWIESYSKVRDSEITPPRLFLTGPHLDMPPPAYPTNSYLIRDIIEARDAVNKFADQGASAIKVYFRLPAAIIKAVCYTAHQRGIPVTAHLEITSATQAIEAGVDGIEHITSFGTDLLPTFEAEQYKQSILADNNARRDGRYDAWNAIDLEHQRVDTLLSFLKRKGTIVSPTLGAFEYRFGEGKTDTVKVRAFENMVKFTGMVFRHGIPVVTGSHSWVPYAEVGWAFQREMELLAESGLSNMEVIVASTIANARFLRIEDRLGSIEVGKQADLLLIEGDPLQDLDALYSVRKVMLNGVWVE